MSRTNDPRAEALAEAFLAGRIDRRQLFGRAAGLGVGLTSLGGVLSMPKFVPGVSAQANDADLTVAINADIDTLDPHISQLLLFGNTIRFNVFSSLIKYSPTLEYTPDLAESWENPDEKTYVFTLREGATYHDGQAVEASHVEFSYKRIAELDTVFSSRVANIASYEVVDTRTIKITLTEVQADFLDGLILLSIISPEIAETVEQTPVGSGPFKFVEWVTNDHISLERFDEYYEEGIPAARSLTFNIIPETQAAIANLQSGSIQGVLDVPVSQAAPLRDSGDVTPVIVATSSIHMYEMLGKNNESIRNDVRVRQALAHALDKTTIQNTVFSGEGRPKWSWVPGDSWAYKELEGYPYDIEKAKALLEEAGVSGLEFTCLVPTNFPDGERATTIWQQGLAEAGVKMNIELQELSVWLDNYINHTYDVIWNVFPGFADPNYFVSLGLMPHLQDGWTNADALDLATRSNRVIDQAERTELYAQLQDLFVQDLPVIIIQEAPQASVTAPNVTGWEINPLGYVILRAATVTE
jgi:peptide/nickel transport system substrate-binding protein